MITSIYLPEETQGQFLMADTGLKIPKLNRVNVFIGPNNSGKSRFLRTLFSESFHYDHSDFHLDKLENFYLSLKKEILDLLSLNNLIDISSTQISGVRTELDRLKSSFENAKMPIDLSDINSLEKFITNLTIFSFGGASHQGQPHLQDNFQSLSNTLKNIGHKYKKQFQALLIPNTIPDHNKIYIPILRGLRPIQVNGSNQIENYPQDSIDNYRARTIRDYFTSQHKKTDSLNIFTGLSMYKDSKKLLLGPLVGRTKIRDFQTFLSQNFFDGQEVSIIPSLEDDCLHITLGGEERAIYNIGDGIQSIITLLYPVFFNSDSETLYFIEEPELNLHPGMQRLFIDTIMKPEFKKIQFFITTHSNHFLDMILDQEQISIYNFKRTNNNGDIKYNITNSSNSDIQLLDSIGVRNSSVFLSNCTIWVEGVSDRLYINKFMDVFQRNKLNDNYEIERLKEDLHYSFIEYGGANIVHFTFDEENNWEKIKASSISSKILVIVDEDGTTQQSNSTKSERINELKKLLGENLVVLPCREIENLLSVKVLNKVINQYEKKEISMENIKEEDYKFQYLGKFIKENISDLKRKYADQSGTIYNKVAFCKSALQYINSIEDLSTDGRELAKQVWGFIRKNNGKIFSD